jgi:hypothetical protein
VSDKFAVVPGAVLEGIGTIVAQLQFTGKWDQPRVEPFVFSSILRGPYLSKPGIKESLPVFDNLKQTTIFRHRLIVHLPCLPIPELPTFRCRLGDHRKEYETPIDVPEFSPYKPVAIVC